MVILIRYCSPMSSEGLKLGHQLIVLLGIGQAFRRWGLLEVKYAIEDLFLKKTLGPPLSDSYSLSLYHSSVILKLSLFLSQDPTMMHFPQLRCQTMNGLGYHATCDSRSHNNRFIS